MKSLFLFLFLPLVMFGDTIVVNVKGLVCPTCAIGIKKNLYNTKKVKTVDLDIIKQQVKINVLPNKFLSDMEIIKSIDNAGYKTGKKHITRTQNE